MVGHVSTVESSVVEAISHYFLGPHASQFAYIFIIKFKYNFFFYVLISFL